MTRRLTNGDYIAFKTGFVITIDCYRYRYFKVIDKSRAFLMPINNEGLESGIGIHAAGFQRVIAVYSPFLDEVCPTLSPIAREGLAPHPRQGKLFADVD
jgi:hypothetical protein